jgi:tyrosyl-tRNA synthetase
VSFGGSKSARVNFAKEIKEAGLVASVSAARRLIKQGGVELVGLSAPALPALERSIQMLASPQRVTEPQLDVEGGQVFRVGKHRFLRITDPDRE